MPVSDAEWWEPQRAAQQALTDARRESREAFEDKVAALNRAAHEAREEQP